MDDRYEISKISQGMKTLAAQFSLLQLEKTLLSAKKMRLKGQSEKEVMDHVNQRHSDLDPASRKKIYQLSLGLKPPDDIDDSNVEESTDLNETTVQLKLREEIDQIDEGSLVFYRGERWVVVRTRKPCLDLKKI